MATYTTNYNLKKPALADKIRIADFNGNSDTIDGAMHDNAVLGAQLKSDIGIVENTNTATHNISAGQYVIWKGDLYTASSAISSGATLSDANLTAVSGGGLNALNSNISAMISAMVKQYDYQTTFKSGDTITIPTDFVGGHLLYIALYRYGIGDYVVYSPNAPINMQTGLNSNGGRGISFQFNANNNPTSFTITSSDTTTELFCSLIRIA